MAYGRFLKMEKVYMSGSCHVRSHFIRQVDAKNAVNGIATSLDRFRKSERPFYDH